jgi:hypothetical protein
MNQFGASAGGAIYRDRTFFFVSYEGLIQRKGLTQIGFVPSDAFRARVPAALAPLMSMYPQGQTSTKTADVLQWTGVAQSTQDEHVGLVRLDHRFSDKFTSYFRFVKNSTDAFTPNSKSSLRNQQSGCAYQRPLRFPVFD